jgi:hypothetical protein
MIGSVESNSLTYTRHLSKGEGAGGVGGEAVLVDVGVVRDGASDWNEMDDCEEDMG